MVCNMRKMFRILRILGLRRRVLLLLALATSALLACWWSSALLSEILLPRPPPDQNLAHFMRSTNLHDYIDNIEVLIGPSVSPCLGKASPFVLVSVTSAAGHREARDAVRDSWGAHYPTVFFMGVDGPSHQHALVDSYMEARLYGDIVVYDFVDHYQNLTLKTALMLKWTLERCPQATFMFKTDDDVFVNPWTLDLVLSDHTDAQLIGYRYEDVWLHRDPYNKWYCPRWLRGKDRVEQYLSGTGYIISGAYLKQLYDAAFRVPMLNLEDIFLTYAVASQTLGLSLTHDPRLSPYKPWLPNGCVYWSKAYTHSLTPQEIINAWTKITPIAKEYQNNRSVCEFFNKYLSTEWLLY